MSTGEGVWILGIKMTKFGKHPDKDTVDLAAEATLGALADAGVRMKDMGVLAAGNLVGGQVNIGQQLQKQVGQTGIPVSTWPTPAPPAQRPCEPRSWR